MGKTVSSIIACTHSYGREGGRGREKEGRREMEGEGGREREGEGGRGREREGEGGRDSSPFNTSGLSSCRIN